MSKTASGNDSLLPAVASVAVAIGVFCRLDGLGRESLWLDEVYTARRLALPSPSAMVTDLQGSPFPPLYYLALRAWVAIVGRDDAAVRGLAAAFGLLAILATPWIWSGLIGKRAALWALALLATNAFHIWYSRDAKMYSVIWLLATVACGAFLHAIRCGRGQGRRRWLVVLGLANGCLPLVSYVGVVPLGIQAITGTVLFARRRELRGTLTRILAMTTLALIPTLVWVARVVPAGTDRLGIDWITRIAASRIIPEIINYTSIILLGVRATEGTGASPGWVWSLPLVAVPLVMAAVVVLLAASLRPATRSASPAIMAPGADQVREAGGPELARWLAVWTLLPVVGSIAFSLLAYPLWGVPRYLTGAAPAVLLWVAVAIDRSRRPRLGFAVGLAVIAVNVALVGFSRTYRANPPWREIARVIANEAKAAGVDQARPLTVLVDPFEPFDVFCLDFELSRVDGGGVRPPVALRPSVAISGCGPFLMVKHGWKRSLLQRDGSNPDEPPPFSGPNRRLFHSEVFADPYKMIPSPIFGRVFDVWQCRAWGVGQEPPTATTPALSFTQFRSLDQGFRHGQ